MIGSIKKSIQQFAGSLGYDIRRKPPTDSVVEQDKEFIRIYEACKPYTLTSKERMYALYTAVQYIVRAKIPGDFVECGVWKGGSAMLIGYTLCFLGVSDRNIYLYDTYTGMSEPTEHDVKVANTQEDALPQWKKKQGDGANAWRLSGFDEVKKNMQTVQYPREHCIFVQGKVEDTIPANCPTKISLLRLDTDWYESTKHELEHLYPRLAKNGVLIIDDYGCWAGAKKAVDEYFIDQPVLLQRIDQDARLVLKTI